VTLGAEPAAELLDGLEGLAADSDAGEASLEPLEEAGGGVPGGTAREQGSKQQRGGDEQREAEEAPG
jgi:hypothetical protein